MKEIFLVVAAICFIIVAYCHIRFDLYQGGGLGNNWRKADTQEVVFAYILMFLGSIGMAVALLGYAFSGAPA